MPAISPASDAREFFVARIAAQAVHEGTPLTDVEIKYLEWRRIGNEDEQERLHENVDRMYGESSFEDRMSGLLWRAMQNDAATDRNARSRYRENYDRLDGEDKDWELWVIATPVINPPQPAFTRGLLLLVGLFGIAFTLMMIFMIIRYVFWK